MRARALPDEHPLRAKMRSLVLYKARPIPSRWGSPSLLMDQWFYRGGVLFINVFNSL